MPGRRRHYSSKRPKAGGGSCFFYRKGRMADQASSRRGRDQAALAGLVEGSSAPEQARRVFQNISAVLAEAGTDLSHVVKATVFLADMNDFAAVNEVYAKAFEGCPVLPARSAVQVARLPKDVLVEIEVIAVR